MNIKEMKEMLQLMAEHNLTEIEIEKDGLKVKLKKSASGRMVQEEMPMAPAVIHVPRATETSHAAPAASPKAAADNPNVVVIKSPMVGTFYSAPSPDQPAYTTPGKRVKEGDVLCIVEAMKLMNEIKAEVTGQIVEIMVKNGQPVEFDQPLFKLQKG
jgi:acetyl-CoA carboxylase biotin carboxyl carrier protein